MSLNRFFWTVIFLFALIFFEGAGYAASNSFQEPFCGSSTYDACNSNSDCVAGGCSGSICSSKTREPIVSNCLWRDCFDKEKYNAKCECVNKQCAWTIDFDNSVNGCMSDSDCKLIYNSCSCEAVLASDSRTVLEPTDRYCDVNDCINQGTRAVCSQNRCVKRNDAYSVLGKYCETDSGCKIDYCHPNSCITNASEDTQGTCAPPLNLAQECACIVNQCVAVSSVSDTGKANVKIMPENAIMKAKERLGELELNTVLKQKRVGNGGMIRVYYEVAGEKEGKIFGLFSSKGLVRAEVDALSGEIISVRKPWWAFLAKGI